jgi:hypothetical protein
MILTTKNLLQNVVYGFPSGNYDGSSLDFFSDPVQAANYYHGRGSIQTITFNVTGFIGKIKIQASLQDTIGAALWFDVDEFDRLEGPVTQIYSLNAIGNFVWLRAEVVGFEAGTITLVSADY